MFVSFYSYKGGVGRTQLLVNAASYLCYYKHKKVLLLEWDLEAPGLHYYFGKKNTDITQDGLIEILEKYMNVAHRGAKIQKEELPFFTEENIVKELIVSKTKKGRVDLIPCANYSKSDFTQKINDFDWRELTEMRDGNVFIDFLKTKLKEKEYDYIFIDSRTGIADYSGICNILLPDVNVIVVAPTDQNFEGALRITKAISEHPYLKEGNRKPFILPILSRIDKDATNYEDWVERFENEFGFVCDVLLDEKLKKFKKEAFRDLYVTQTTLFYSRSIALGENRLFDKESKPIREISLSKNYEHIANYIDRLNAEPHLNFYDEITTELLENWLEENNNDLGSYFNVSSIFIQVGNLEKAKEVCERGIILAQKQKDIYSIALFYQLLGEIETSFGNLEKALFFYEEFNKGIESLNKKHKNVQLKKALAVSYFQLGKINLALGNLEKAFLLCEEDVKISEELYKEYPQDRVVKKHLAIAYGSLGRLYLDGEKDNLQQSLILTEKGHNLIFELSNDYNDIDTKIILATSHQFLGYINNLKEEDNLDIVLLHYRKYNEIMKKLYENYPENTIVKDSLSVSYQHLGKLHLELNELDLALYNLQEAFKTSEQLYNTNPTNVDFKHCLAVAYFNLAYYYEVINKFGEAENYLLKSLVLFNELVKKMPSKKYQDNLIEVKNMLRDLEEKQKTS